MGGQHELPLRSRDTLDVWGGGAVFVPSTDELPLRSRDILDVWGWDSICSIRRLDINLPVLFCGQEVGVGH